MRILKQPAVWYSLKLTGRKTPSNYITVISEITKTLRTAILPKSFPVIYRESQHAPWLPSRPLQRRSSACYILRYKAVAMPSSKRLLLSCVRYIPCSSLSHYTLDPFQNMKTRVPPIVLLFDCQVFWNNLRTQFSHG